MNHKVFKLPSSLVKSDCGTEEMKTFSFRENKKQKLTNLGIDLTIKGSHCKFIILFGRSLQFTNQSRCLNQINDAQSWGG